MSQLSKNALRSSLLALAVAGLFLLSGCPKDRGAEGGEVTVTPLPAEATSMEKNKKVKNALELEKLIAQAAEGNLDPLRTWIATEPGGGELYQALRLAVERSSLPAVRLLVEAGADVNRDPENPILLLALQNADDEAARVVARYLVERGADTSWKVQTESAVDASPPELTPCHCLPELCGRDFPPPSYTLRFGPYRYEQAVRSPDCSMYYKTARIVDERTNQVVFQDATPDWISAEEVEFTGQPPEELYVYVYYRGGSASVAHAYAWTRDEGEPRNIMAEDLHLQMHPILADLDGDGAAEMAVTSCYHVPDLAMAYAVHIPEFYGYDARLRRMVYRGGELTQVYRYLAAEWYRDEILGLRREDNPNLAVGKALRYWALSYRAGRGDEALAELRKELERSNDFNYVFQKVRAGTAEILPDMQEAAKPRLVLGEEGAPPFESKRYPYYEP